MKYRELRRKFPYLILAVLLLICTACSPKQPTLADIAKKAASVKFACSLSSDGTKPELRETIITSKEIADLPGQLASRFQDMAAISTPLEKYSSNMGAWQWRAYYYTTGGNELFHLIIHGGAYEGWVAELRMPDETQNRIYLWKDHYDVPEAWRELLQCFYSVLPVNNEIALVAMGYMSVDDLPYEVE